MLYNIRYMPTEHCVCVCECMCMCVRACVRACARARVTVYTVCEH